MMRALLAVVLLVAAARPALAEETWAPIEVEGIEYEVRLPPAADGRQTYRMPPGRLDQTLERLGRRTAGLARDLEGTNLPSEISGAPDRMFQQVSAVARVMGPDLVFANPPRLLDDIAEFTFNDGKRLISFAVSSPDADRISQQVGVVVWKRVAGEWKVERRQSLLLDRDDRAAGSAWRRASYSDARTSATGVRRSLVELQYDALAARGRWFGSELRAGQRGRRFVLRDLDPRSGEPVVSPVARPVARRIARQRFRLLTASSPRAGLRALGVAYVRPTAGRRAHLRRLPARRPSARR